MLVGRESERLRIDALVAGARVGSSGVLLLTGEAGIGKTTLLEYACGVASGVRLLRAAGSEVEQDVPFGGLAQLLRPTPEELDRIPPPQAQALGVALALRQGAVADRLAVGAAVLSLLVRYSEDRPVGVVIDDAHLLDRPSAEALAFACRRFLADSVFVVAAARSQVPHPLAGAGLPELALAGLDAAATAALVLAQDERTTAHRSLLLHRATGGNPLAVLELAHDQGRALSLTSGSPAPIPIPTALVTWFGRRIAELGEQARALLLLTATAGGDLAVVGRAAAASGLAMSHLADAERAGLVVVGTEKIDFVHPLMRAAAYALAYPDERRRAHATVADAVPAQDADRRAWHRCEAVVGTDAAVADAMEAVAVRAQDRAAHAVCATAYQRAARLSTDARSRAVRLLSASEAAWHGGDGDAAVELLQEALTADLSATDQARGLALQAEIAAHRGSPGLAQELYTAAADALAPSDPSQAVLLLAEATATAFYHGSASAALAAAERIQALLDRSDRADNSDGSAAVSPAAGAVGRLAVGMSGIIAGRSGVELIREGARRLELTSPGQRQAIRPAWLMYGPLFLRESGTTRALVRTALDEGRARSAVTTLPMLLFAIARDGATTEHWAAAEADYGESIALARELGHPTELAMSLAGLAWLEARRGRTAACRAHAEEVLALCERAPVTTARVWAQAALGELELAQGEVAAAADRLAALAHYLVEIDLRDPDLSPAPELAEALLRGGDLDGARRVAAQYLEAATTKGLPWACARAARLDGMLAAAHDLDEPFARALDLHTQTLDVFEEARTRLAYGARLRRARRRVDARVQLRAALHAFERLGAHPWATAAAAELEATGESVAPADLVGETSDAERLTPRELQIALLLADGRTTREAAAALFLSPKTVEYHLRHVYTKLDISSRPELMERLRR